MIAERDVPALSVRRATKRFGKLVAFNDVSFDVFADEFFAILGPSGCGKTTLLRAVAGLETLDRGDVLLDGRSALNDPPQRRPVNMVFQSYALFPHMTVAENVAYGLKFSTLSKADAEKRVDEMIAAARLEPLRDRMPELLSGGQRQRVALARALAKRPKALLLDEPLSALDAKLRAAMRLELVRLRRASGAAFVMVTHDQEEALSMASRIAVMNEGRIHQIDPPKRLYERPADPFVADFIGEANLLNGHVVAEASDDEQLVVRTDVGDLRIPSRNVRRAPREGILAAQDTQDGRVAAVAARPEKIRIMPPDTDPEPPTGDDERVVAAGRVLRSVYYGDYRLIAVSAGKGVEITVSVAGEGLEDNPLLRENADVLLSWARDDMIAFLAE